MVLTVPQESSDLSGLFGLLAELKVRAWHARTCTPCMYARTRAPPHAYGTRMACAQEGHHVLECSATQCTLEQIFIAMASKSKLRKEE